MNGIGILKGKNSLYIQDKCEMLQKTVQELSNSVGRLQAREEELNTSLKLKVPYKSEKKWTPVKNAVIILKFEQCGFSIR